MNWEKAKQHLDEVLSQYQELIGMPGVNPYFGIAYLKNLLKRYEWGERTQDLYDEMMECE
jgi:hypothetical protein